VGLDLFKLQKLKIFAFSDGKRQDPATKSFEAMYNPATYSQTYSLIYARNNKDKSRQYLGEAPSDLSITLVLDGTGVDDIGVVALTQPSVSDRIQQFLAVTYNYDSAIHEASYLRVEWGDLKFPCRLASVTVKYTLFDRDGTPLRAELAVRFLSDQDAARAAKAQNAQSPDVTHSRIVRHGDTLPLLTRAVYGSSARYLDVARFNDLDDFRRLTPGQQLFFPPLAALGDGSGSR
jgi:hypothetical protein